MKRLFSTVVGTSVLATAVIAGEVGEAQAFSLNFSIDNNFTGGDPATVTFNLEDNNSGGVDFDVSTDNGTLRGLFFDIDHSVSIPSASDITGSEIKKIDFNTNNLKKGNNINGGSISKPSDIALSIGRPGGSAGSSTSFTIAGVDVSLFTDELFAARLQNTSPSGTGRGNGSSKLVGIAPSQPVPEPITMLGWGTGLAVGALAKKKYGQKKSATSKV